MDVVVFHGEGGRGVQVNKSFPANQSVLLHVLHKQGKSVKQTFFSTVLHVFWSSKQSLLVLLLHFLWSSINQSTMHRGRLRKGYCSCKSWITAHARWAMPLHCKLALQRLQRKRLQGDPNSQMQTLQMLDIEELNENHAKRCPCCCHASSKEFQFFEFCQACWKPWEWSTRVLWCTCEGTKLLLRGTALSVFIAWCGTDSIPTFITQSWRWLGCRPDGRGTSLFGAAIGYFARPSWLESKGLEVVKSLKAAS